MNSLLTQTSKQKQYQLKGQAILSQTGAQPLKQPSSIYLRNMANAGTAQAIRGRKYSNTQIKFQRAGGGERAGRAHPRTEEQTPVHVDRVKSVDWQGGVDHAVESTP